MTPTEYCENKVRQNGSSFYFSFLFLTPEKRLAMTALYAFCREVDDIVDECSDANVAQSKLNWWRQEIYTTFNPSSNSAPSHPVCQVLQPLLKQYPLKMQYFLDIIQGTEMDLHHQGFQDFSELESYCYHVAGSVALLSIAITGYQHPETEKYAKDLGTALQLTKILRDVKEDMARGRLYIPAADLQQQQVTLEMLEQGQDNENIRALFAFQAQRAESYYQKADAILPTDERYNQRFGLIMAAIDSAVLQKIKKLSYPVLTQGVRINPLHKLWLAWNTARREFLKSNG